MDTCLIFKNFFGYDPVLKVPHNLPENIAPIYITDSVEAVETAASLGWNVIYIDSYKHITDKFERRKIIAWINCFPEKLPGLEKYKYIFVCDSNVIKLDTNYAQFISHKSDKKALYVTSGWYSGVNNTMQKELERSLQNMRWSYNFEQIKSSTNNYIKILSSMNIPLTDTPVVSAKYIG